MGIRKTNKLEKKKCDKEKKGNKNQLFTHRNLPLVFPVSPVQYSVIGQAWKSGVEVLSLANLSMIGKRRRMEIR